MMPILNSFLIPMHHSKEVTEVPMPEYAKYIILGVLILIIIGANILAKKL